ncbi:hypothetical protein MesoLj113a_12770 [Mesorhizobium sp. 113-1-2]|nr:hypothetical protein MesoLj113a_12770 [Mesorhizobium sp. 113-1-2]
MLGGNLVAFRTARIGLIIRRARKPHVGRQEEIVLPGRAFVAAEINRWREIAGLGRAGLLAVETLSLGVIGRS